MSGRRTSDLVGSLRAVVVAAAAGSSNSSDFGLRTRAASEYASRLRIIWPDNIRVHCRQAGRDGFHCNSAGGRPFVT